MKFDFNKLLDKIPDTIFGIKITKHKIKLMLIVLPLPFIITSLLILLEQPTSLIIGIFLITILMVFMPYFLAGFLEFREISDAESNYPAFIRDLAQGISSGMSLPTAIEATAHSKYGTLTTHIAKLHSRVSWGIPFPQAWKKFSEDLADSQMINRVNGVILEAFMAGGDVGNILTSLSTDVNLLKRLESDKKSLMTQQIMIMYVIFFIFMGILVALHSILTPILFVQKVGVFGGISLRPTENIGTDYFKTLFLLLTIVQSASMGIMAGQIAEEKLIAGFKHVMIMLAIGLFTFFVFIFPTNLVLEVSIYPPVIPSEQEITMSGSVSFDASPAGGARIDIILPDKNIISTFADAAGDFSTAFKAPLQPGNYPLVITATYSSESETRIEYVQVII